MSKIDFNKLHCSLSNAILKTVGAMSSSEIKKLDWFTASSEKLNHSEKRFRRLSRAKVIARK